MDSSSDPYSALTSNDIQAAKQAAEASIPIVDWLTAGLAFPDGVEFMRKGGAERTHAIQDVGIEFAQKCVNLGLIGVDYHMQDNILPGILPESLAIPSSARASKTLEFHGATVSSLKKFIILGYIYQY